MIILSLLSFFNFWTMDGQQLIMETIDRNTDLTHILLLKFGLDTVTNDDTKTSIRQKMHALLSDPVGALINNDIHHVLWKSPTGTPTTFYHTTSNLNSTALQIMMDCGNFPLYFYHLSLHISHHRL